MSRSLWISEVAFWTSWYGNSV